MLARVKRGWRPCLCEGDAGALDEVVAGVGGQEQEGEHEGRERSPVGNEEEFLPDVETVGEDTNGFQRSALKHASQQASRARGGLAEEYGDRGRFIEGHEGLEAPDAEEENGGGEERGDAVMPDEPLPHAGILQGNRQDATDKKGVHAGFAAEGLEKVSLPMLQPEQRERTGHDCGDPETPAASCEHECEGPEEIKLLLDGERPEVRGEGVRWVLRDVVPEEKQAAPEAAGEMCAKCEGEKSDHSEVNQYNGREPEESAFVEIGQPERRFGENPAGDQEPAEDEEDRHAVFAQVHPVVSPDMVKESGLEVGCDHQ